MNHEIYVDTNNIVFIELGSDAVTEVASIEIDNTTLTLELSNLHSIERKGLWLVVDDYKRFIYAYGTDHDHSHIIAIPISSLSSLNDKLLSIYLYTAEDNQALSVNINDQQKQLISQLLRKAVPNFETINIPSFTQQYIDLIIEATKKSYVSISNVEEIRTGNNYQTIDFGSILRQGGRPQRNFLLRQLEFQGKSVLDIGANTGEISRTVRRFGADIVDGVEYDRFFVETGRMINGATGMTRVSLFQGDASQPGLYQNKKYSIVLAMAVYVYINKIFDVLAKVTDVLVLETHTLDHGIGMYIDKVKPHFPVVKVIGYPDFQNDVRKSRALIVFAKDSAQLNNTFKIRTLKVQKYFDNRFFEQYEATTPAQFPDFLKSLERNYKEKNEEDAIAFGSVEYFVNLLLGFSQFESEGKVSENNIFLRKYLASIRAKTIDKTLSYMLDKPELAARKIEKKYQDIQLLVKSEMSSIPPIIITESTNGHLKFTDSDSGRTYSCSDIDGHHRFFAHQLLSIPKIEYFLRQKDDVYHKVITTNYSLK